MHLGPMRSDPGARSARVVGAASVIVAGTAFRAGPTPSAPARHAQSRHDAVLRLDSAAVGTAFRSVRFVPNAWTGKATTSEADEMSDPSSPSAGRSAKRGQRASQSALRLGHAAADGLRRRAGSPGQIAYQTCGKLNAARSNAILVCHALTGDQYVGEPQPDHRQAGLVDGDDRARQADRHRPLLRRSAPTSSAAAWARPARPRLNPATGKP